MERHQFDVTIAGEINLDLILYGLPETMPLERELIASRFEMTLGSSSAILAHNLAVLGAKVGLITSVGEDELGAIALKRLGESGVDLSTVRHESSMQTGVTVILPHGGRRHILTCLGTMATMSVADLDFDYLSSGRHFHLSSLFLQKGLHAGLPQLFRDLKEAGLTVSLDTNDDPEDEWAGVLEPLLDLTDILLPNRDELLRIAGKDSVEAALDLLAERVPLIVVKAGSAGAILQQGRRREYVPAIAVEPVDTIGAGDSFNAGFLHAWLRGEDAVEAASLGNMAGALSTLRAGGTEAFRDRRLVDGFLKSHGKESL